jgi:hypothetical protein
MAGKFFERRASAWLFLLSFSSCQLLTFPLSQNRNYRIEIVNSSSALKELREDVRCVIVAAPPISVPPGICVVWNAGHQMNSTSWRPRAAPFHFS